MPEIMPFLVEWVRDWRPDLARAELRGDTRLVEDLGLDSLALLELVASIESRFDVQIRDEDYRSRKTFGTLADIERVIIETLNRCRPRTPRMA
ncbi:acyl carrier protein [Spirillospora sp. NPDC052242]